MNTAFRERLHDLGGIAVVDGIAICDHLIFYSHDGSSSVLVNFWLFSIAIELFISATKCENILSAWRALRFMFSMTLRSPSVITISTSTVFFLPNRQQR